MSTSRNAAIGALEGLTLATLLAFQLWWALAVAVLITIALEAYASSWTAARRAIRRDHKHAARLSPNVLRGIANDLEASHEP